MLTDPGVPNVPTVRKEVRRHQRAPDAAATVVWLRGEYDAANAHALRAKLVLAMAADDLDLVLHLGEVTFLDASTITAVIEAKTALSWEDRVLSLRALSPPAARIVEICGLHGLIERVTGSSQES